jgi:hypothetical protein
VAWRVAQGHIDAAEDEGVRHWQSERYAASEHANKRTNHAPFSIRVERKLAPLGAAEAVRCDGPSGATWHSLDDIGATLHS